MEETRQADSVIASSPRRGVSIRWLDSLFVMRPTLMFPLWTMILAGYKLSGGSGHHALLSWVLFATGLSAIFGVVYIINQITDRKTDQKNQKLFLICNDELGRRHIYTEMIILVVAGPLLLIIGGFESIVLLSLGMLLFAGLLYSYKPIALQRSPIGGIVSGLVGGFMLLCTGGLVSGKMVSILEIIPYLLAFTASCILTGLLDTDGDRVDGKRTFAVVYGIRNAILTAFFGVIGAVIIGLIQGDWVITTPALVCVAMLAIAVIKKDPGIAVTANKFAIFILSVTIGIHFPIYLLVILVYYLIARWYHRKRFGMVYPSFAGPQFRE